MKKAVYITLALSIILNVLAVLSYRYKTAYFNETHLWTPFSMETGGVLIFNNQENQPKNYVQYYKIRCQEKGCIIEEITLSDKTFINNYLDTPEVVKLSYESKEAVLRHKDCLFTVTESSTTFNCTNGNETGQLGNHIKLHSKMNDMFR